MGTPPEQVPGSYQEVTLRPFGVAALLRRVSSSRPLPERPIRPLIRRVVAGVALGLLGCACSSGAGADHRNDGRAVAIQKALDESRSPRAPVIVGDICSAFRREDSAIATSVAPYKNVPQAHVTAVNREVATSFGDRRTEHCWNVTWSAGSGIVQARRGLPGYASIGRLIVDKVGDDQQQSNVTVTPYRAHFEPNALGKSLASAGVVRPPYTPKDITDGQAVLHKDADGSWVAQL
jgi:hypothetical protein